MSVTEQDHWLGWGPNDRPDGGAARNRLPRLAVSRRSGRAASRTLSQDHEADADVRWPARATLLFICAVCGGFWLTFGAVVVALVR